MALQRSNRRSVFKRFQAHMACYEKHRKVQIFVTVATLFSGLVAMTMPEYAHAGVIAGVATNLIWVWE